MLHGKNSRGVKLIDDLFTKAFIVSGILSNHLVHKKFSHRNNPPALGQHEPYRLKDESKHKQAKRIAHRSMK